MLIRPDGAAAWNANAIIDEPRGTWDKPTKKETGDKITESTDKSGDVRGLKLQWALPQNFCAGCEAKNVDPEIMSQGTQGIFHFDKAKPELHMTPGDVIIYYVCGTCWMHERFGCKPKIFDFGHQRRQHTDSIQENRQRVVETYVKMLILRGEKPVNQDHGYVG